jgi:hypothetical protein
MEHGQSSGIPAGRSNFGRRLHEMQVTVIVKSIVMIVRVILIFCYSGSDVVYEVSYKDANPKSFIL